VPVKVYVFDNVFNSFKAVSGAVFKNTILKTTKITQVTFSDPSLPKQCFFERQL
jgi:hypothetical protein